MTHQLTHPLRLLLCGAALSGFIASTQQVQAQGTAFNYQGRLGASGGPANGSYDFTFALFASSNGVGQVGSTLTNVGLAVSNGLFSATLDFGSGVFTGANLWLSVGVRTNGGGSFAALNPLQPVVPVPYAVMANSASNLLGTLPAAQLSGTLPSSALAGYTGIVTLTNPADVFGGTFSGGSVSATTIRSTAIGASGAGGSISLVASNGTGNGGGVSITAGNAGTSSGGAGGNVVLQAGNPVPQGGSGYSGLGTAGAVSIAAGDGYNNVGGDVTIASGHNGPWTLTANSFSKVSLQGGTINPGDGAVLNVEGGHNTAYGSPPQYSAGGNIVLTGGTSSNGYAGGNIVLMPGSGTPNGYVGVGKTNPATALDVNGTVTATVFSGNASSLTNVNAANLSGTVPDTRLSGNVALRSAANTFTANQTITGTVSATNFSGNGAGLTNLPLGALQSGGAATAQILTWNGASWAPSNAAAGSGGLPTSGGSGTNESFFGTTTFNGPLSATNVNIPAGQSLSLQSLAGTGSGGNISLLAGNAGSAIGGAGGNLLLQAGNPVPQGGSGYGNLGNAGSVTILGGDGYNNVGGDITLQSGHNGPWTQTLNSYSKISLQGGTINPGDGATLDVEGGRNTVYGSPPQYSAGGNVRINGGTSTNGYAGGNIILMPGSGSPNGNVGIGKTNPATALDVSGTITATGFSGNGGALTSLNYANITNPPAIPNTANLVATNDTRPLAFNNPANQIAGNGGSLTNLALSALQRGGASSAQVLTWNGSAWVPSNAPAGGGSGLPTSGGAGTNETFFGTTTFNGPMLATNLGVPAGQNLAVQSLAGSGSGGGISITAANAGSANGGAGGNISLQAGNPVPQGGSGYGNLGSAGAVSITAGDGYNNVGGNVTITSGHNGPWTQTLNSYSKVSLQGGTINPGDGATIDVEGGHNTVYGSPPQYSGGGNVRITAGTSTNGYAGGHIVLMPGTGSPVGNVGIGTNSPVYPLHVGNGAYCSAGGVWTSASDRNVKENFSPIDSREILAKVAALPITEWNYKTEPDSIRHLGPVAQDFKAAFGLGDSDKAIGTIDESGVALAAIQGLNELVREKETEIQTLKTQNCSLEKRLNDLAKALQRLEER